MKKLKKLVAAAVTAASMCAIGLTAFADHWDNFSFSLEGQHWDNYIDVSAGVEKHNDWNTPATVTVNSGNVSPTNRAFVCIAADASWPESSKISEEVLVTRHDGTIYTVRYNTVSSNLNNVKDKTVYLYATTGFESVSLAGFWTA